MVEKKAKTSSKVGEKMAKAKRSLAGVGDYGVLLSPVITEKSSVVAGAGSRVVFKVRFDADKTEIRDAVERIFNVKVASVNTVNYQGKPKRTSRSEGFRARYKKAYVTLQAGQSINVIEGV